MLAKKEKIIAYVDGGSRGNPGPAAFGAVIFGAGKEDKEYCQFIGQATNNEAEYQAAIFALKKIRQLAGKDRLKEADVEIRMDSQLVVEQLNGRYKVEDREMQRFFMEIWNLKFDFSKLSFIHIPREQNQKADALANKAMDQEQSKLF